MKTNQEEFKKGVEYCVKTRGIAYTYTNDGSDTNRVLLNPDWVRMHSPAMAIIDYNNSIITINKEALIFKNRIVAEGALMALNLMHPKETASFIIDEYKKDAPMSELKVEKANV